MEKLVLIVIILFCIYLILKNFDLVKILINYFKEEFSKLFRK